MSATQQSVKEWLSRENRTREWLAKECGVAKQTVNNWLSSPRGIPSKALLIIERLMENDRQLAIESQATPQNLVLEFTTQEFEEICEHAASQRKTPRKWAIDTLNEIAGQDLHDFLDYYQNKVAEDSPDYPNQNGAAS